MREKVFEIREVTYIVSGKLVLAGFVEKEARDFNDGDSVIIILPNGDEIKTKARGGGTFKIQKKLLHSVLVDGLKKEDIPLGSIVFADDN